MRAFFISALEILEIAVISIGAVFLVRTFLLQPFLVNGESMVPSFHNNDYLLVDELTYRFRQPERGEVVVFRYPVDQSVFFIKRVIGLPNERVAIKNNQIEIFSKEYPRGFILKENYLSAGAQTGGQTEFRLSGDEYLVLGDNRSYSFDSRSWGILPGRNIIGLARLRLWPLPQLQAFAAPQY